MQSKTSHCACAADTVASTLQIVSNNPMSCQQPETKALRMRSEHLRRVLYLKMLSRSWSSTLPSSTILLTTELILLYQKKFSYVFCQQLEKARRMRIERLPTLYLDMLSRSWSTSLPSSTILLTTEPILLYLTHFSYAFCQQLEATKS